MRPCECLIGLELDGGWKVESYKHRSQKTTDDHFSVGYLVKNKRGKLGYLKALDFSGAFQSTDPSRALEALTKAYNFERDLLSRCQERKFDRVVTPISAGKVVVPGDFRELGNVMYLIFELAVGDVRNEIENWRNFDVAWVLRSLHQSSVGISQLHSINIAHQDIRPSNLLVFPLEGTKISDLERASHLHTASDVDRLQIPGENGYAPPEYLYNWNWTTDFLKRYMADVYLLGSLIFFYFLGVSATQAITTKLARKFAGDFVTSNFEHDLPYVQQAFSEVLNDLNESVENVAGILSNEIVLIARQLCEPDPRRRGDPTALESIHRPNYDLQPYISRFDRLAKVAESRMII